MKGAGPARRRTSSISALIVSLIVVSSVFSGAVSISIPVLAKGSNAFKMVTPTTQTKTTQLRDRPDTTNNNNYNNLFTSNTPSLIDNNNISSSIKHSELGEQTLRSDSVHSQLKRPTLWFGSDNTSSSSQDSNTR